MKRKSVIENHYKLQNLSTTNSIVLDCFGRASLAMTTGGGHQSCSSYNPVNPDSDNFAMTAAWGMTNKRLFAGVLDCFVPRNDERASDSDNFAMTRTWGMTSVREMTNDCSIIN
jgi:hypothetical protein